MLCVPIFKNKVGVSSSVLIVFYRGGRILLSYPLCTLSVYSDPYIPIIFIFSIDVLLVPKRVVQRFTQLHPDEVSDLFKSVHTVSKLLEVKYRSDSLTILIQVNI